MTFDVDVPVASDAEAERFALFGAITDLLSRAGSLVPIVVVLDDLHWADKPTVQLLRHLTRIGDPMRLMVIGTYRSTDIGAGHPLAEGLTALRREPGVEFVELAGLNDLELLDLIEATAGVTLEADGMALRDAISTETDGNPFFATEIVRHLTESGAIDRRNGRSFVAVDVGEAGLPVSVRQVVGDRVARLGADTQRLLRTAAVIGRDFDLDLLLEVADVDEDAALDLLDGAAAAQLIENIAPDRYCFAHALVQHALYEDLTPTRRARVHRRIGLALESRWGADPGDRIGELANHWAAAVVPHDATKAAAYRATGGRPGALAARTRGSAALVHPGPRPPGPRDRGRARASRDPRRSRRRATPNR